MRRRRLFIDGTDAGVAYGVYVADGGYQSLVQFPDMVEPGKIDWPEVNGIEPDLLTPRLRPKESIRIDFVCDNAPTGVDAFIAALQNGSYHMMNFKDIAVTIPLRYKQVVNRNALGSLEAFTLEMAFDYGFLDDGMLTFYNGETTDIEYNGQKLYFNEELLIFYYYEQWLRPLVTIEHPTTGLVLGEHDMSYYNCLVLEGANAEITKGAPLKDNLVIKANGLNGQLYPDTNAVKGAKDVMLPMLLRAVNPTEFWHKYTALLTALVATGYRTLTWNNVSHKCYYQRQAISKFAKIPATNEIWCRFDLSLCFYEGD